MQPHHRTLGFGLAIGGLLAASIIFGGLLLRPPSGGYPMPVTAPDTSTALAHTQTPAASQTPAATPTFTPIPTFEHPPNLAPGLDLESSPTSDPIAALIAGGGLIYTGPLTHPQQSALHRAAISYARRTVPDSVRAAKEINGVGYGDPSNICGPLAIAILRDAKLIAPDIVPHDFWLLDPRASTDQNKLELAFPSESYEHTKFTTSLNRVDWITAPLKPGDFLFIWHGSGGNFDHMLVVSRVDSGLRAYAVTNFGTPDGYIIAETMLYDPADPNAGIFYAWTKEKEALLGSTGFGGYDLWRLSSPQD